MYFCTGLINHFKYLKSALSQLDGEAEVSVDDLSLALRVGTERRQFLPQFSQWKDGRRSFTPTFHNDVRAFIGWRPHIARSWAVSMQKLEFRRLAKQAGVGLPLAWQEACSDVRQFIVKQSRSSFGEGIRGPFETIQPGNSLHVLAKGEYYEQFIPGRNAKAWYIAGELLCLEMKPPAFITCDGRSTILALVDGRRPVPVEQESLSWIVNAQGLRLSDVPAKGKEVVVDFKYGSVQETWRYENENVLSALEGSALRKQFEAAGRALFAAVPSELRDTLYTLDAVVDSQDQAWFLEMNSNPMVHPDCYPVMLRLAFEHPPSQIAESREAVSAEGVAS